MTPYGKLAQTAIAALSWLAELHAKSPEARASSGEVAKQRNLPPPMAAKALTILSQAGIVAGMPGPHGGYRLARPPGKITLLEVVELFERTDENIACPFGPQYCGHGPQCPLHADILALRTQWLAFLQGRTLAAFVTSAPP